MSILITSMIFGLILSFLALGVFISFRVFDFPDITVEGSFTTGAALAALLIVSGCDPLLSCLVSFAAGMVAGALTGLIHTRFRINQLLSGILVMTALYSVNLHVMGRSNLPMPGSVTIFNGLEKVSQQLFGQGSKVVLLGWSVDAKDLVILAALVVVVLLTGLVLRWFLRTNLGTAMRATGDNDQMIRALGVDTKWMIVFGIALANGFVALSGALLAQFQGFADVQMGIGMMVWGLASVIIGEVVVGRTSVGYVIFGAVLGSVLFRLLVAIALRLGMNPNDLKIITAAFVFIALILPGLMKRRKNLWGERNMLELNNIKKTFHAGTVHEVRALNGVSLTLEKGSFVCVLGSNGSGKSTLLNAIAGTFPIDEGTIRMDGTDITAWPEHRRARYMGRVFQNPLSGTAPNMTIGENISLALRRGKPRGLGPGISHGKKEEYRQMVRPLNMDLEERLDNPIGKLSGGQRQALTLLMASALQPKLLLLDEHTAALDPKTAARVTEITQMIITRDSLTTLMVTHSMHQAVHMGDRLIMMHQGRVAYDFKGEDKKRLKVNDLLALFDDLRRKDAIDPGVAALLSNNYV